MIRFNCPNCGRFYELPDALARLPLVCKQCGERITPPEPTPEPPPPPPPPKPSAKPQAAPAKPTPSKTDEDVLVGKPDSSPEIDFNIGGPTAASLSEANRARPAGPGSVGGSRSPEAETATEANSIPDINLDLLPKPQPKPTAPWKPAPPPSEPPEEKPEPTLLPFLADLVVFVLLVVAGMFLGELLVGKSTGQVLSEAGSAPKFPPLDLIVWAGPPVVFALVYILLGKRDRTLGAWIRRRRTS